MTLIEQLRTASFLALAVLWMGSSVRADIIKIDDRTDEITVEIFDNNGNRKTPPTITVLAPEYITFDFVSTLRNPFDTNFIVYTEIVCQGDEGGNLSDLFVLQLSGGSNIDHIYFSSDPNVQGIPPLGNPSTFSPVTENGDFQIVYQSRELFTHEVVDTYMVASDPCPEPTSITLFGIAAIGLLGYEWRRTKMVERGRGGKRMLCRKPRHL